MLTSNSILKDRTAARMFTAMQRIAANAVMKLKHLQTTKNGSGFVLTRAEEEEGPPPVIPLGVELSPSAAFVAIFV